MVQSELDSFYVKFKHLLRAEKDATLTIKSEAGRAVIVLSVDLGHVLSEPGHQSHQSRNGPARQRRREKRAAAREQQVAAEKAETLAEEAEEELEGSETAEKVEEKDVSKSNDTVEETVRPCDPVEKTEETKEVTAEEAMVLVEEPEDELCPDDLYAKHGIEKPNPRTIPSSYRGSDGVDYYTLSYEDPSDSD